MLKRWFQVSYFEMNGSFQVFSWDGYRLQSPVACVSVWPYFDMVSCDGQQPRGGLDTRNDIRGETMNLLVNLLELYSWVLIVRILMSWFNPNPDNQIVQILYRVTEPVLAPVRNILPAMGGFDLSPLLVFFAIRMLQRVLLSM